MSSPLTHSVHPMSASYHHLMHSSSSQEEEREREWHSQRQAAAGNPPSQPIAVSQPQVLISESKDAPGIKLFCTKCNPKNLDNCLNCCSSAFGVPSVNPTVLYSGNPNVWSTYCRVGFTTCFGPSYGLVIRNPPKHLKWESNFSHVTAPSRSLKLRQQSSF